MATAKYNERKRVSRRPSDPTVTQAFKSKTSAEQELADVRSRVAAELSAPMEQGGQAGQASPGGGPRLGVSEADALKADIAMKVKYIADLDRNIESLRTELKAFNEGSLDLENEKGELASASEVAHRVRSEVEAVQVELEAPARVKLWSEAKVPIHKDDGKRVKAGAAAAGGAFLFALLGVSYWDFIARRVAGVDQVVDGLGIRLVGTLPMVAPKPRHSGDARQLERDVRLVESIDAMRAVLLHASRAERARLLMITSAVQGEGKTSLACHLAGSLARAGRRTLLLDCDLRRPTCHRLFGMPPDPGLCEYLRGEAELDEVVRETETPRLLFMPAGLADDRAVSALAQDVLIELFERLRDRFDFVVIDSAPILPVADSLLVGQVADAVIFSVMSEVSRLPSVYAAYERLSVLGVKIMGAVVANVPEGTTALYESADVA